MNEAMHGLMAGLLCFFAASASAAELRSPDGRIRVTFNVADSGAMKGCPCWSLAYRGKSVLEQSRLGLVLEDGPAMDRGFRVGDVSRSTHAGTWHPVYGERSEIPDNYNEMTIDLVGADDPARRLRLTFRAYDEGAALRYTVPRQEGLGAAVVESEETRFTFTGDHRSYNVYSAQGFYEVSSVDRVKPNCERPLTVEIEGVGAVAVGEAALVDFARMRLRPVEGEPHTVAAMLGSKVEAETPFTTPWRFVMVGDAVGQLIERNYLPLNLNEPCAIEDTSWIKPGKVIREVTLTTAGGKACVDFAVERGLQYVEYDAGWYGPENDGSADARTVRLDPKRSKGPLDLHEVIAYARSKGIGVFLYVNRRHLERQLDDLLPLYKSWGVKGMKFGFVQVGSQEWTSWLHKAVRKAADYEMLVDVHDEYRPTGYSRTYPNLLTQEGIRGNECMPPAEHNLILPFTRGLCGAGDYTVCWYCGRVKNTLAHQLACSVVMYSPLQFLFWYDRPKQYKGEPQLEFFRRLPTVWDETLVLEGEVGRRIVMARRSGAEWYVAALNAVERRQARIPLAFLDEGRRYKATMHMDGQPDGSERTSLKTVELSVDSSSVLEADMAANGGMSAHVVPIR